MNKRNHMFGVIHNVDYKGSRKKAIYKRGKCTCVVLLIVDHVMHFKGSTLLAIPEYVKSDVTFTEPKRVTTTPQK